MVIANQDTRVMVLAALMVILSCASEIAVRRSVHTMDVEDMVSYNNLQKMLEKAQWMQRQQEGSSSCPSSGENGDKHTDLRPAADPVHEHCYQVAECTLESCRHDCRVTHFDENLAYCQNDNLCCCKYVLPPFDEAHNPGPSDDLDQHHHQQQQQQQQQQGTA